MCHLLGIAPSGQHAWLKDPMSESAKEDARLLRLIIASFNTGQGAYDTHRVFLDLREAGEAGSKHRVTRLMRANSMGAHAGYRTQRYIARRPVELIPNMVKRNFDVSQPDRIWVTDIAYIHPWEG